VYRGSSHRRQKALHACPKFDRVWLNRSPIPSSSSYLFISPRAGLHFMGFFSYFIPVGRGGVISLFRFFLPAFPRLEGGGGRHPVICTLSGSEDHRYLRSDDHFTDLYIVESEGYRNCMNPHIKSDF
jgi:hypothetical protein